METKKCGRCKEEKPLIDFNKCASQHSGFHSHCRVCQKEVKKIWREKNKEWEKEYTQIPENAANARARANKKYKEDLEYRARHLEINRERRRKEPAKIKQRANESLRRKINPTYRIRANLNGRLKYILNSIDKKKNGSIVELISCSLPDFIKHIESKWMEGMNWSNYGREDNNWQIDHILPCCGFDLTIPEQIKICYHYTNMQPLWRKDNVSKGAKLPNGQDARVFNQTRKYRKIIDSLDYQI